MGNWKIDRTTIFLCLVFLLFLVDLAYFLGIRDPSRFPHPFVIFRTLGDVEFLRGFPRMLRYMILSSVSGGLIGIGVACSILRSVWLTQTALRALRLGLWLPSLILFATPDAFALTIATAMLYSCYHYLTFFPFVQALWALRDRPVLCRILLTIDNALPIAFVAMLFGELWAATAGLGFMMIVASATSQFDKGLAGFLVTVALLMGLSSILRWTAGRLYYSEVSA